MFYKVNVPDPVNLTIVSSPEVDTQETHPGAAAKHAGLLAVASLNITIPVPPFPPVWVPQEPPPPPPPVFTVPFVPVPIGFRQEKGREDIQDYINRI